MSMLHTKGSRGWMRALIIVMVSLSLTLSMPAKPAMAVGIPVFDGASLAKLAESFVQQVTTKIINMAMQKLMQEANKALGPVLDIPILGEFVSVVMDGMAQDLTDMVNRGSNDLMGNIFRSPQQNFQDCMNSFACTSNIQLGNNFTASFKSADYADAFQVTTPSALPAALQQNSFKFGDVAGLAVAPIQLAGPATQISPNVWEGVTRAGGDTVTFAYSGSASPITISQGAYFTTPDATPDFSKLAKMDLNVGKGALTFSNVSLDGGNPYTMTASPALRKAIADANSTNKVQTVNGIEVKPGLTVGSDGKIGGDIAAALNFGGAQVSATFGVNGGMPAVSIKDVGKALCPNLTEQDKVGGAVCRTADAAVSGLVGCAFGGNFGECAKGVGKNAGATLARGLLGSIRATLGVKGSRGASSASSSGLQVAAADKAIREEYFCPSNNNTAECVARVSAKRATGAAEVATATIAEDTALLTQLPQMKKDCDDAVKKALEKGGGNANTIAFSQLMLGQCYNGIDMALKMSELRSSIARAQQYLVTAPTALSGTGG